MNNFKCTYRCVSLFRQKRISLRLISVLILFAGGLCLTNAQTPAGSQVINQSKVVYKYKSIVVDTIQSNAVIFVVSSLPNFEFHYSFVDSNVVGKETLMVWLSYKNIGNTTADSIILQNILPSTGMKFVRASNNGTNSGGTLQWIVRNVPQGKSDSVSFAVVIDSLLAGGTVLKNTATFIWGSNTLNAEQNFYVGSFPRLHLAMTTIANVVGSGRTLVYQLVIKNTGNVPTNNTIVRDTISAQGSYVGSSIQPESVSVDKKIITWNLGSLPSFSQKSIDLTVITLPNLGHQSLRNGGSVEASNVIRKSFAEIPSTPIVPIAPKFITITATPTYIFGFLNRDSSLISVSVLDSARIPLPDGVPVAFLASPLGTFFNSKDTITAFMFGGKAEAYIRSVNVQNDVRKTTLTATAGVVESGFANASADVFMYPGAVTGIVRDAETGGTYKGAMVRVEDQGSKYVGADTTKEDGKFFVPLNKEVTRYTVFITIIDKNGDTLVTHSDVNPVTFPKPPIPINNIIAGRIQYAGLSQPIPIPGITIYLDSVSRPGNTTGSVKRGKQISLPNYFRVQEQKTDFAGRFKFENLAPAIYKIYVDSVAYPNFAGSVVTHDTVAGTFTLNFNIHIKPDTTLLISMRAASSISAGDTLTFPIRIVNPGNIFHTSAVLQDTIPKFVSYLSATKGNFNNVVYDSITHTITWKKDTLQLSADDSVFVSTIVQRNIPDSTKITNTSWLHTKQLTYRNASASTIIRSSASMLFGNFIPSGIDTVFAGDSVQTRVWFRNDGTDSLRNVIIVDTVYNLRMSTMTLAQKDSVVREKINDSVTVISWKVKNIAPARGDTIILYYRLDPTLKSGSKIISNAHIVSLLTGLSIQFKGKTIHVLDNPMLASFLKVVKSGNKKVAEIGDVVTYQVVVSNSSPTFDISKITVNDRLPHSFKYFKNSSRYNGKPILTTVDLSNGLLTWDISDTLQSSKSATLTYQVVLGADALESDGINTAYAGGIISGQLISAVPSSWTVTVKPGVFTEKGLIIGKVFYDDDRNAFQSEGEIGVKNVEIWMEDGTRITTGDDGKFSIPDVKPGQHVLRIIENTLPKGSELIGGNIEFAKDPVSRFVRLTEGGIAKANFYLKRLVADTIKQTVSKMVRLTVKREAYPKNVYKDAKENIVEFTTRFSYSGNMWLQLITAFDKLPSGFSYLEGSAMYNGRVVAPAVTNNELVWKLGRSISTFNGELKYKARVTRIPSASEKMLSQSRFEAMTIDSTILRSDTLLTENILQNVLPNDNNIKIEEKLFIENKSTFLPNTPFKLDELTSMMKKQSNKTFVIVTYPDAVQANFDATKRLVTERSNRVYEFLNRRLNNSSVHLLINQIFDETILQPQAKSVQLEIHTEQSSTSNPFAVYDTSLSISKTSITKLLPVYPASYADSMSVITGDEVVCNTRVYLTLSSKAKSITFIDTLPNDFVVNERSFAVNNIPVGSNNISIKTQSSPLSSKNIKDNVDVSYSKVISLTVASLLKSGVNQISFRASIPADSVTNALMKNTIYIQKKNEFDEISNQSSNAATIVIRQAAKPVSAKREPVSIVAKPDTIKNNVALQKMESLNEKVGKAIVMEGITFVVGNANLTSEAKELLNSLANALKENPALEIQINGHTDNTGSAKKNKELSKARAQSVKNYFIELGIESQRLTSEGYGSEKPMATNATKEGKAKNRRVEFVRVK